MSIAVVECEQFGTKAINYGFGEHGHHELAFVNIAWCNNKVKRQASGSADKVMKKIAVHMVVSVVGCFSVLALSPDVGSVSTNDFGHVYSLGGEGLVYELYNLCVDRF